MEDEYSETGPDGNLIRLGKNIRSYNQDNGWAMKWFDALHGTWLDLGPEELGGVMRSGPSISFKHYAPGNVIVRITFFDILNNSFSWKADLSKNNGESWEENVFTIEAIRKK